MYRNLATAQISRQPLLLSNVSLLSPLLHVTIMKLIPLISSSIIFLATVVSCQASQKSDGCGKPIPRVLKLGESRNFTFESASGKSPRKYRLHVPTTYKLDEPVPLIFSFHGRGKDMEFQEQLSQFSNQSYGFNGIAVYPEGVPVGPITTPD